MATMANMAAPSFVTYVPTDPNNPNSKKNTAVFDINGAKTSLPSYTRKEGAYGTYDDSLAKQKSFAGNVADKSTWNKNLQDVAKTVQLGQHTSANPNTTNYQARNVQEGYTTNDLNLMTQNGMNGLNQQYNTALNKASADYNRMGLGGSGFEIGSKFGNQPDSITSNYLQNAQKVYSDVAQKGLEAAREDRYKNAEANDKNRYDWLTKEAEYDLKARDYYLKGLDEQAKLMGVSDRSQLDWGNINGGLAQNDDNALMDRYKTIMDVFKTDNTNQTNLMGSIINGKAAAATGGKEALDNYNNSLDYTQFLNELQKAAMFNGDQILR